MSLCDAEPCELSCLEKGRRFIGALDQPLDPWRYTGGQAEAQMDGRKKAQLERLVIKSDRRLERADHVADHIFRRIMQKAHEPPAPVEAWLEMRGDSLHQHAMLR